MSMQNTSVLITGGSRGLGRALALEAARRGARVVAVARTGSDLDRTVRKIRESSGIAWGITADLGDKEAIHRIAGEAAALAGPIDLLVNNASTLGPLPMPLLLDTECEDLEQVLAVNLVGPFRLSKVILGNMALRGTGTVLNISSDAAVEPYPTWGAYGLSKAALDHLSRVWAAELDGTGVRVLSIDPGEMDTDMHRDALPDADPAELQRPADVARRILDITESGPASGSRLEASAEEEAA